MIQLINIRKARIEEKEVSAADLASNQTVAGIVKRAVLEVAKVVVTKVIVA